MSALAQKRHQLAPSHTPTSGVDERISTGHPLGLPRGVFWPIVINQDSATGSVSELLGKLLAAGVDAAKAILNDGLEPGLRLGKSAPVMRKPIGIHAAD